MASFDDDLADLDPAIAEAVAGELRRQQESLGMIASENLAPRAVLQAQGSVLTNKYAEGYPGRRYYSGCEYIDDIERLATERVKRYCWTPNRKACSNRAIPFSGWTLPTGAI